MAHPRAFPHLNLTHDVPPAIRYETVILMVTFVAFANASYGDFLFNRDSNDSRNLAEFGR